MNLKKGYWVPIGTAVSILLFFLSANAYPGGYEWNRDYISTLFAQTNVTGSATSFTRLNLSL